MVSQVHPGGHGDSCQRPGEDELEELPALVLEAVPRDSNERDVSGEEGHELRVGGRHAQLAAHLPSGNDIQRGRDDGHDEAEGGGAFSGGSVSYSAMQHQPKRYSAMQ